MAQNSIKIGSWRLSWPILSLSWAVLGLSWPVMGLSWLVLGLSWACLGLPWVCLGSVLGLSWLVFGLPWPVLGLSWAVLACLGLSWACLVLRRACLQTFFNIVLSGIAATRVWCSVLSACSFPFPLSCRAWAHTFLYTWRMDCCRKLMLVFTCWFSFLPCSAAVRAQHIRRLPKGCLACQI